MNAIRSNSPWLSKAHWLSVALLALTGACQRTVEGLEEDTRAAAAAATDGAERAKRELSDEMGTVKAKTSEKLEELSVAIAALEAKTKTGLDDSKQKVAREIDETRAKLDQLQGDGQSGWQDTKSKLELRLQELRARMSATADKVEEKVEKTLD